jgi:hypothetical protein
MRTNKKAILIGLLSVGATGGGAWTIQQLAIGQEPVAILNRLDTTTPKPALSPDSRAPVASDGVILPAEASSPLYRRVQVPRGVPVQALAPASAPAPVLAPLPNALPAIQSAPALSPLANQVDVLATTPLALAAQDYGQAQQGYRYFAPTFSGQHVQHQNFIYSNADPKDMALTRKSIELAQKIQNKKTSEQAKKDLRNELKDVLAEQFNSRQAARKKELNELKARVEKLEKSIALRDENQDQIIEKRMGQLMNEPDPMGWEQDPTLNSGFQPLLSNQLSNLLPPAASQSIEPELFRPTPPRAPKSPVISSRVLNQLRQQAAEIKLRAEVSKNPDEARRMVIALESLQSAMDAMQAAQNEAAAAARDEAAAAEEEAAHFDAVESGEAEELPMDDTVSDLDMEEPEFDEADDVADGEEPEAPSDEADDESGDDDGDGDHADDVDSDDGELM